MNESKYDVIILGSGPAGLTAAIYASRSNLKTLVVAGYELGGQLMLTTDVEDYPGFPDGIQGPELMKAMKAQAEKFGAEFVISNADKVDLKERPFKVWVSDTVYAADSVIVATGASAKWLGIESEKKLTGRGVSSCAVCDGAFFKEKPIVVIGGGDTAMKEALYLSKFGSSVTVIHRRDKLRAFKAWQDRAFENPKIKFVWNSTVEEFIGENKLEGVKIKDVNTGEITTVEASGAFVAIGHTPNTAFLEGQLKVDEVGYLMTDGQGVKTSIPGVFAAGDVHDLFYKQAVTAAGSGCKAALEAEEYLESLKSEKK